MIIYLSPFHIYIRHISRVIHNSYVIICRAITINHTILPNFNLSRNKIPHSRIESPQFCRTIHKRFISHLFAFRELTPCSMNQARLQLDLRENWIRITGRAADLGPDLAARSLDQHFDRGLNANQTRVRFLFRLELGYV